MPNCPVCKIPLEPKPSPTGLEFHCPQCQKVSVGTPILRKRGVGQFFIRQLFALKGRPGVECPHCGNPMEVVILNGESYTLCHICNYLWTDKEQITRLPMEPPKPTGRDYTALDLELERKLETVDVPREVEELPSWRKLFSWMFPVVLGLPQESGPAFISYIWVGLLVIDMLTGNYLSGHIPGSYASLTTGIVGIYLTLAFTRHLEPHMTSTYFALLLIVPTLFAMMVNVALGINGCTLDASTIALLTAFGLAFPQAEVGAFMVWGVPPHIGFYRIPVWGVLPLIGFLAWMLIMVGSSKAIWGLLIGIAIGALTGIMVRGSMRPANDDQEQ